MSASGSYGCWGVLGLRVWVGRGGSRFISVLLLWKDVIGVALHVVVVVEDVVDAAQVFVAVVFLVPG